MHRDATTKKGHQFYAVQISTGEKVLTAGVREVSDGKGETYIGVLQNRRLTILYVKIYLNLLNVQYIPFFNFLSKKGKVFDEGTLRNNLVMLMNLRKENTETSFSPMDLLSREIIHTWSEDSEDVQWEGKILSHANGVFKVLYWNDKEKTDSSVFDLTEQEINKDIEDGNLFFKDAATRLDHSYI
eukprot:XP_019925183.1 PREDICTED: uncharacterized protein LOC105334137 [Crassostrea gigas]